MSLSCNSLSNRVCGMARSVCFVCMYDSVSSSSQGQLFIFIYLVGEDHESVTIILNFHGFVDWN